MYDGGMETLCLNETKAAMRSIVCKVLRVWAKSLVKVTPTREKICKKGEHGTVYTLPATIWELEQQVAFESLWATRLNISPKECLINLRSFEVKEGKYDGQNLTRSFMLNDSELYPNFSFDYHNEPIHANCEAKSNFFGWFDWTGLPTAENLEVLLDPKNFVPNSVVFATFSAAWRRTNSIPTELINDAKSRISGEQKLVFHTTDAVEKYLLEHTGHHVKCVVSVEYQAQQTPMMLIGLTNSRAVLDAHRPERERLQRSEKKVGGTALNDAAKNAVRADLRSCKYTKAQIMQRNNATNAQVRSVLHWLQTWGDQAGYAEPKA